jgi:hypothetical protein
MEADIKFWKEHDANHAKGRQMAYAACLEELKDALERNGLTLGHIGLAGYEVPKIDTNEKQKG